MNAEKARLERLERLRKMLESKLDNPAAALEMLMSELKLGELRLDLWEGLHAAAARDELEVETAWAYQKITQDRRLRAFSNEVAAQILVNAANFSRGVLGDEAGAEEFLLRSLRLVPNQPEPFDRLARRYEQSGDSLRLVELCAAVVSDPPIRAEELGHMVGNAIGRLPAKSPVPDETCRALAALVGASPPLLDVLETHGRKTVRMPLVCELLERAIDSADVAEKVRERARRRVVALYLGEARMPAKAMPHVEVLFDQDLFDERARAAATKLLSTPAVAGRAAACLHRSRSAERREPPRSPRRDR